VSDKKPSRKGELRRRIRALFEDGSVARLGSEGRLVANWVFHVADWSTCEARFSYRRAAKAMCSHVTSVRRAISQMIEAGIIEPLGKEGNSGKSRFRILERAQPVLTPDTPCARERARPVRAHDTPCARTEHTVCAPRTRPVRAARTPCARESVLFSGSPVRTSESTRPVSRRPGRAPSPRRSSAARRPWLGGCHELW
jgi:hypothetical protein